MNIVSAPILIPIILMILLLILRSSAAARILSVAGSAVLLLVSLFLIVLVERAGILSLNVGGWEAPFGITLVIDRFSSIMLLVSSLIILAIAIYAIRGIELGSSANRFYLFFFSLTLGMNGALISGDVFNLYVWFEVLLISSFVLITFGCSREQLRGGIKYLAMNLIGSLFFLAGIGLLYGKTGTLNMANLSEVLRNNEEAILMNTSAMLFFIAFGIKAAIFPLFFWLPASYHTPNITITALFAGLLTKVGVYAMVRFFSLFFVQDQGFWHNLLLVVAGLTMLIGGMAASARYEIRKILSWHIISQIGYMIMGLGIFTTLSIAGGIFFIVHNMIAKTNTFLVAGLIGRLKGSYDLKSVGGLFRESPTLAILFIIPALALAGVPPLSGFFAKFILIKAGIEDSHYGITAIAILTGLLTLYSMIKIWNEAFLKKQPGESSDNPVRRNPSFIEVLPLVLLGLATIAMGVFAEPVYQFIKEAAIDLIDGSSYIDAILNQGKL
jgi:multicomponent Na+:H+ antiporter subunit D